MKLSAVLYSFVGVWCAYTFSMRQNNLLWMRGHFVTRQSVAF